MRLTAHPSLPPLAVTGVEARIVAGPGPWLRLRWRIEGSARLLVPPFAGKARGDKLWTTTCFELFLRSPQDDRYLELNLSPSERWAAYDFTAYRQDMHERPMPGQPQCTLRAGRGIAIFDAAVPSAGLPPPPWDAAPCAVLEEEGGRLSYWAPAHGGARPDFHDPACFTLHVPAPAGG